MHGINSVSGIQGFVSPDQFSFRYVPPPYRCMELTEAINAQNVEQVEKLLDDPEFPKLATTTSTPNFSYTSPISRTLKPSSPYLLTKPEVPRLATTTSTPNFSYTNAISGTSRPSSPYLLTKIVGVKKKNSIDFFQLPFKKKFNLDALKISLAILKRNPDFTRKSECLDSLIEEFGNYMDRPDPINKDHKEIQEIKDKQIEDLVYQIFKIFLERGVSPIVSAYPSKVISHPIFFRILNYPKISVPLLTIFEEYSKNYQVLVKETINSNVGNVLNTDVQSVIVNYLSIGTVAISNLGLNTIWMVDERFKTFRERGLQQTFRTVFELAYEYNQAVVPFLLRLGCLDNYKKRAKKNRCIIQ